MPRFDFTLKNIFCNCNESSFLISHFKVFNCVKYSSSNSSVLDFRRDEFKALGWRAVVITVLVIMATYYGAAIVAHIVLVLTGVPAA